MQKIRQWYFHRTKNRTPKPAVVVSLLGTKHRKVVPLTHGQAYSLKYCTPGSLLHNELHKEHELYKAADKATLNKYQHVFTTFNPKIQFLNFQQAILKEKVLSLSAEELSDLQDFIDETCKDRTNLIEHPWSALRTDESQTEAELERQYIKKYVPLPPH